MAINLTSPAGFTSAVLIADTVHAASGSSDSVSSMTKVGGVTVSAALEIQSTLGGLLLPRMTTAQIAAIVTPIAGMQVFNTDTNAVSLYQNGGFNGGLNFASVTLNQAAVQGMYAAPALIIAAPAAGFRIFIVQATLINNFATAAFAGGGLGVLQYAATIHGGGTNALNATIPVNFFTAGASTGYTDNQAAGTLQTNYTGLAATGIYLSNQTGAFTTGNAASTVVVNVLYYVLPAAI